MTRFLLTLARLLMTLLLGVFVVGSAAPSPGTPKEQPLAAPIPARQRVQEPTPRFRTDVEVVAVDVCVKGRDGRFIPGLNADDFLILEHNVQQKVTFFSPEERVPLAVVLLIDRSHSMHGAKIERAKAAAAAFLRTLRPDDLVEVVAFNERANRLFPLAVDHEAAEGVLAGVTARGLTGLFEAVLVGLRDLERAQRSRTVEYRNAIVLLSDGEDTSSLVEFDDVLEDVRRSGTLVYAISLRTDKQDRWLAPLRELSRLAFDSGGLAVAVRTLAGLVPTYEEIATDVRHLYRLGYVPSPSARDGRWHPISVRVPGKDVRVRARAGYYAARPAQGLGGKP